jgi:adenosyl cobinamide kinase/adenosyl cobinamide phosphate guanylyltransferase
LARENGAPVTFIATGEPGDEEMTARIVQHRRDRPPEWETIEEPRDLDGALAKVPDAECVIVDCLSLWVSNLLGDVVPSDDIVERATAAADMAATRAGLAIVVTNEVGSGIVPVNALARIYRDVLGRVNATWATRADKAALTVAGRALWLD